MLRSTAGRIGLVISGAMLVLLTACGGSDELLDECFDIVNDRNKVLRILAIAKSAIRHNMSKDLPDMKMPVCLIWGRNDTITPPEVAVEFEEKLPDAELFWIDECGHAPMMEHPELFNNILGDWLKKRNL